ncbi:hypothetical protein MNO14_00065 [Luteimonas sp. S4-F44]|uniref:hypothetical protein n=1 Tax=Luteimonas sp. S4-F44 TaxID=2925842 RepID=UPI001F53D6C5|nr:hypothetical protein [Luteimonas sp. S4-F44]UNK42541.1 hypothetical protein MNO14_00065 [Luteimonas sp. S4-F44]
MALPSLCSSILRNLGDVPLVSATALLWNRHDRGRASERCMRASGHTATGCREGLQP